MHIFILHLSYALGRLHNIKHIIDKLEAKIFYGLHSLNIRNYNNKINILETKRIDKLTIPKIKESVFNIINYAKNNNVPYFLLLEDDIIIHKYFDKYYQNIIEFCENKENKWKLLYLGVSSKIENLNNNNNLIQPLQKNITNRNNNDNFSDIVNGAFAVIINHTSYDLILPKVNDSKEIVLNNCLEDNNDIPYDINYLGFIQRHYKEECFITNPQLFIADVSNSLSRDPKNLEDFSKNIDWQLNDYIISDIKYPFYILLSNDTYRLPIILELINVFVPYFTPYILSFDKNYTNRKYQFQYINSEEEFYEILNKTEIYGLTNPYIHWSLFTDTNNNENYDFINNLLNSIKTNYKTIIQSDNCPKCNNKNNIFDLTFTNNKISLNNNKNTNILKPDSEIFYLYNSLCDCNDIITNYEDLNITHSELYLKIINNVFLQS